MKHFTDAEKQKAVDLYFSEKLTTQGVVDRLGYPTRQNLERWLRKDPRYGENMRHGFYPDELKIKAVEMYHTAWSSHGKRAGTPMLNLQTEC